MHDDEKNALQRAVALAVSAVAWTLTVVVIAILLWLAFEASANELPAGLWCAARMLTLTRCPHAGARPSPKSPCPTSSESRFCVPLQGKSLDAIGRGGTVRGSTRFRNVFCPIV